MSLGRDVNHPARGDARLVSELCLHRRSVARDESPIRRHGS
ncbi:hypothetical protein BN903_14 [Halorubrum sp. AJ67]|nr:hypothetical protein BN903_14 [Halorubrum sp. AJ67]